MKKPINGSPLELWNSGDLLDYLDECIHDSQVVASELIYATDNTDNKVDNVFTTSEFDTGLKVLIKEHKTTDLEKLKEVIKQLLYEGAGTTQNHISGDVLLHYRYWGDNTLIISLGVELPTENGASFNRKFWADHIVSVLSEKTSAIKISCHNYNDYADWFKGSILFSFPNILCSFQISVADDNLISSVDDIVYIVDFLYDNMIASGLADVVRDGEIFTIEIEADYQEVRYLEDNDDEWLDHTVGDWKQNLPQLFRSIEDYL